MDISQELTKALVEFDRDTMFLICRDTAEKLMEGKMHPTDQLMMMVGCSDLILGQALEYTVVWQGSELFSLVKVNDEIVVYMPNNDPKLREKWRPIVASS